MQKLILAGLLLLYLLHNDFWNWWDTRLFLGLPVGLLYHILYCVGVALFFFSLLHYGRVLDDDGSPDD